MPTDLPYAADAEVSLSYDELEVSASSEFRFWVLRWKLGTGAVGFRSCSRSDAFLSFKNIGTTTTIQERARTGICHYSNQVQLCLGPGEESCARTPGGRRAPITRLVSYFLTIRSYSGQFRLIMLISLFYPFYVEIYRAEPGRRRECLYYLALGHYKMGNYEDAKKFNGMSFLFSLPPIWVSTVISVVDGDTSLLCSFAIALLIDKEPANLQAQSLGTLIDNSITKGSWSPHYNHVFIPSFLTISWSWSWCP